MENYPKRLIEVDLPIKLISNHARREKSIRHGHISTLHIWWARRPLAACRAVICASLWPDPVDELCPPKFRETARQLITDWGNNHLKLVSDDSFKRFVAISKDENILMDNYELRKSLLSFIADFSNWDNANSPEYIQTARKLTKIAHEELSGIQNSKPLVADPFSGGGSIPLEALRVGADVFASDLNPVAVLLNKVLLNYIPKYGQKLANAIRECGEWVKSDTETELNRYYPKGYNNKTPVAYIWARTIVCEGPNCGMVVPMIRSCCLARRGNNSIGLKLIPNKKEKVINAEIVEGSPSIFGGTIKRGSVTCPSCGYTTPVKRVRSQQKEAKGGADSSLLLAVVYRDSGIKTYETPTKKDLKVIRGIIDSVQRKNILPPETLPLMSGVFNVPIYGISQWDLLFSSRQLFTLSILGESINKITNKIKRENDDQDFSIALKCCLFLCRNKYLDFRSTLCGWINTGEKIGHTFGRQALGMIFDWAEGTPFGNMSGSWERSYEYFAKVIERETIANKSGAEVNCFDAQKNPLPDDSIQAFVTDPPYYNAVPYADLSDYFYIWLRQDLKIEFPELFESKLAPKENELCEMKGWDPERYYYKDANFYEKGMQNALAEGRRICTPDGIGIIVFAHKTTAGWESLISALIEAGWVVTASWPIDTERVGRLREMKSAALGSSIHLVCRPRNLKNETRKENIGDWRDVLVQLPKRISQWMPHLSKEGIVGADAIFACLGPALEIYSKYSAVEKASGENVQLSEFLEQVWAAVAKEALNMIFQGADASGFEEDARLTAMWLWTLRTNLGKNNVSNDIDEKTRSISGYALEYDAARKIAQGLGAHLENLGNLVEIRGGTAVLLSAGYRIHYLFGKDSSDAPKGQKKKKSKQMEFDFADELKEVEKESAEWSGDLSKKPGTTVLDQLHQSMILFGAGRGEALRRFLIEDGIGRNPLYWRLAQSLSALYPTGTEEKRWVDGVLARKKSLGF